MKPGVSISWEGMDEIKKKFNALSDSVKGDNLQTALYAGGLEILNEIKRLAPYKKGNLRRSYIVEKNDDGQTVSVGTATEYAPIQEFGGVITPKKKSGFLAIPQRGYTGSPRNYENLYFVPTKTGGLLLQGNGATRSKEDKIAFVLVRSATIPAHPHVRPAMDAKGASAIEQTWKVLQQLMEKI